MDGTNLLAIAQVSPLAACPEHQSLIYLMKQLVTSPLIAFHETLRPDALSGGELDLYLARGWYRMHQTIFTTTHLLHDTFYRVHWLRFPLALIRSHASHRRIRKLNAKFSVAIEDFESIQPEHEKLYSRYRETINFDGASSIHHALYGDESTSRNIFKTKCISLFDGDVLIAAGYFDVGETAGTSILHFFDPLYGRSSPGRYLMLLTIDYLLANGFTDYYPGYVVAGNDKMNYKLFLGKEAAYYFEPGTDQWRPYDDIILLPEVLSEEVKLEIALAFIE